MKNGLECSMLLEGEKDLEESQKAFEGLMKYHKTLRADFDYKKELAEWRDERYGNVTRNIADFSASPVQAILPENLLVKLGEAAHD